MEGRTGAYASATHVTVRSTPDGVGSSCGQSVEHPSCAWYFFIVNFNEVVHGKRSDDLESLGHLGAKLYPRAPYPWVHIKPSKRLSLTCASQ